MKNKPSPSIWLYILLCLTIIPGVIYHLALGHWLSLGMSLLTLVFLSIPFLLERQYHLRIPKGFLTVLFIFLYLSVYLGTANRLYDFFWWWDNLLHGLSGFIFAHMGFLILMLLDARQNQVARSNRILAALFSFAFAVASGGVWEIYEYTMDNLFGTLYQGIGIDDTMIDIILDALGALVFALTLYFQKDRRFQIIKIEKILS